MSAEKKEIFDKVEKMLGAQGFNLVAKDDTRPWGGFFVIDENQSVQFVKTLTYGGMTRKPFLLMKNSPHPIIIPISASCRCNRFVSA